MQPRIKEKIYVTLAVLFSVLVVTGNLTYQKFVTLNFIGMSFELGVGAIIYPLTYLISDIVAEFYGRDMAIFVVRLAIAMNLITMSLVTLFVQLPATPWSRVNDEIFALVFGLFGIAFGASLIACYLSQLLDIRLYLLLKKISGNKLLLLRNLISTSLSLLVDTITVLCIMYLFGILPFAKLGELILSSYSYKLLFAITLSPIFYLLVLVIRKKFLPIAQKI